VFNQYANVKNNKSYLSQIFTFKFIELFSHSISDFLEKIKQNVHRNPAPQTFKIMRKVCMVAFNLTYQSPTHAILIKFWTVALWKIVNITCTTFYILLHLASCWDILG